MSIVIEDKEISKKLMGNLFGTGSAIQSAQYGCNAIVLGTIKI
jgi:hypothetical protein